MAKAKTTQKPKEYNLKMMFNGESFEIETDNLDSAIEAMKPEQMYSELFVEVRRGEVLSERRLTLIKARKVFNDQTERQIFIQNLLLN